MEQIAASGPESIKLACLEPSVGPDFCLWVREGPIISILFWAMAYSLARLKALKSAALRMPKVSAWMLSAQCAQYSSTYYGKLSEKS